jgi:hypothetical protein
VQSEPRVHPVHPRHPSRPLERNHDALNLGVGPVQIDRREQRKVVVLQLALERKLMIGMVLC